MKLIRIIPVILIITTLTGIISCDQRASNINSSIQMYSVLFTPIDDTGAPVLPIVLPDTVLQLGCFVTDANNQPIGGLTVNFQLLGYGYVNPSRTTNENSYNGLNALLEFDPKGSYGEVIIVATIVEDSMDIAGDSLEIEIPPYEIILSSDNDQLNQSEETGINCIVVNPLNGLQTGGKKLAFSVLNEIGDVSPTASSDPQSPSGLQSNVTYTAPSDTFGIAVLVAVAKDNYTYSVDMGSDTLEILVTE